jgi:hypothetical protein
MKGDEYLLSLLTSVVPTEKYDIVVNSEELIGTTDYVTVYAKCRLNRCRYNRVLLYIILIRTYNIRKLVG